MFHFQILRKALGIQTHKLHTSSCNNWRLHHLLWPRGSHDLRDTRQIVCLITWPVTLWTYDIGRLILHCIPQSFHKGFTIDVAILKSDLVLIMVSYLTGSQISISYEFQNYPRYQPISHTYKLLFMSSIVMRHKHSKIALIFAHHDSRTPVNPTWVFWFLTLPLVSNLRLHSLLSFSFNADTCTHATPWNATSNKPIWT